MFPGKQFFFFFLIFFFFLGGGGGGFSAKLKSLSKTSYTFMVHSKMYMYLGCVQACSTKISARKMTKQWVP